MFNDELTRAGKSNPSITVEPPLTPLAPECKRDDADAYVRWLAAVADVAPEMVARARQKFGCSWTRYF